MQGMSKKSKDAFEDSFTVSAKVGKTEVVMGLKQKAPKGLGYIEDKDDARDFSTKALFGARRTVLSEVTDLEGCVPLIADQGSTGSCVGQAIGGAIDTRLRKTGRWTAPLTSRQAIYTIGRALDRFAPKEPLVDDGTRPRMAMKGLKQWGVPTEVKWPFDESKINDELPWDVLQEASANIVTAWWRIPSLGKERIEDMCQALGNGYPIVFGVKIDEAFQELSGPKPVEGFDKKALVGGHMMFVVGYKTVNGVRIFRCVNSWGTGWGDKGFFNANESMFREASDLYVIQVG